MTVRPSSEPARADQPGSRAGRDPEGAGPRGAAPLRLLLMALLLAGVAAAAAGVAWRYVQVDEVELPDVVGLPMEEAARVLRSADLRPVTYQENVPDAPVESVTTQTPRPGTVVRVGRRVSIGVNRPPEATRVPVLTGLPLEQATAAAADLDLVVSRVEYAAADAEAGRVIAQEPVAGGVLGAEEGLRLVVSRGPEQLAVAMPDLSGVDVEAARARLESMGFRRIETVPAALSFDRPGVVVRQFPAAGATATIGAPVSLQYSVSGRNVVKVPALEGVDLPRAQAMLRAAGLLVGDVRFVDDPERPAGVASFEPAGYTVRGSPVALVVNGPEIPVVRGALLDEGATGGRPELGAPDRPGLEPGVSGSAPTGDAQVGTRPADGSRDVPFSFDPARLGVRQLVERPYELRLVVADERGERTVLERRVEAGGRVDTVVRVYGDALLQTYINGVFFQAWNP